MVTKTPKGARYGALSGLNKRTSSVQVRLLSSTLGSPQQVKLTEAEYDAIYAAAREHVRTGAMSAFLRDLAVAAAAHLHEQAAQQPADRQIKWLIDAAAEECSMLPGEYLRVVALEAIGYTRICEASTAAKKALADRVLWQANEDD